MAGANRSNRSNKGVGAQGRSRRAKLAAQRAAEAKRRRERKVAVAIALSLAFALVVGGVVWLVIKSANTPKADGEWPITEVQQTPTDGEPIHFGTEGSKHVEMFVDFHCPHCVTFEQQFGPILQEAESKKIATIDVYPMAFIDQGSQNAANGFACAADAGYPRAYFNALFANATRQWNNEQLIQLSTEIGHPPTPEFEQCINGGQQLGWVQSISGAADERGVTGTPTIFIDGELVDFKTLSEDSLRAQLGL